MIRNVSTGKTLAHSARNITSFVGQAFGLMFRRPLNDEGWVFMFRKQSRWHITNLFVFQTITVLWLDKDWRVLQTRVVKPFTPHVSGAVGTQHVIELPKGAFEHVSVGDQIAVKSKRI